MPGSAEFLYAWMVEEEDGTEGIIAALVPALGTTVLVTSREHVARRMKSLAHAHGEAAGRPVRLVRFTRQEVVQDA